MTLEIGGLNWLAVIVATAAYFAIGFGWYMPTGPTGRMWAAAAGESMDPAATARVNPVIYAIPLVFHLITAIAVAMVARATGSDNIGEGIILGLVLGIGFAGTVLFTTATFETKKPQKWIWAALTSGHHILGITAVALIVSLWR